MAYIRFYSPYHSAFRDENANEDYEQLSRRFASAHHCGCNQEKNPAANITETESEYRIYMALPGIDKKDISIKHENGFLNISVIPAEDRISDQEYNRQEFDYSGSSRNFKIGEKVDVENITAKYDNGILAVSLPKKEAHIHKPSQSIVVE
jgi:HSP20 family protein